MSNEGSQRLSLRGQFWGGLNLQSLGSGSTNPRFLKLTNCYVSGDGQEIRTFPGYTVSVDLTERFLNGFDKEVRDAARTVARQNTAGSNLHIAYNYDTPSWDEEMDVRADVAYLHGFKFVRGRLRIFGESKFRKERIRGPDGGGSLPADSGGTPVLVTSTTVDGSGRIVLHTDINPNYGNHTFHEIATIGNGNTTVFVEGIVDPGAPTLVAELNDQFHWVVSVSGNSITLDTAGSVASTVALTGRVSRTKLRAAGYNGVGVPYYVQTTWADGRDERYSIDEPEALTIWSCDVPKPQDPISDCSVAHVANRWRDFGDRSWDAANKNEAFIEGTVYSATAEEGLAGISRRRQLPIPYRIVPDVAGDRLLMAVPGYSCVFQSYFGLPSAGAEAAPLERAGVRLLANDGLENPRCVGVPKAVLLDQDASTNANHRYQDTGIELVVGLYKVAVAYQDDVTGEQGLLSELIEVDIPTGAPKFGIQINVLHPGYVMAETLAMSVNVWVTEADGDQLFFLCKVPLTWDAAKVENSWKYGLPAFRSSPPGNPDYWINIPLPTWNGPTPQVDVKNTPRTPNLEQMPMGCKVVRTVRGITAYGGRLGNAGERGELLAGVFSPNYDPAGISNKPEEIYIRSEGLTAAGPPDQQRWGMGLFRIPSAYAGQRLFTDQGAFPYPTMEVVLNKAMNQQAGTEALFQRWQVRNTPFVDDRAWTGRTGYRGYIKLPRSVIQFSEAGAPGVVPADSFVFLDAELEEDVEAMGRYSGALVICTRDQTHLLQWATNPRGQAPRMVSSQFGCIAPNTMVEFDGGTCWLSDRGPVAIIGGTLRWIGRDLESYFQGGVTRYLRDSTGMMRHSWACHDPERGLVYFGMATLGQLPETIEYRGVSSIWETASDEARSRVPCDEILVWGYNTGSFSTWTPGIRVKWMERGPSQELFGDQRMRVHFLGEDNRIYSLDDYYGDKNARDSTFSVVLQLGLESDEVKVSPVFQTGTPGAAAYVEVGQDVMIFDAEGELKFDGTLLDTTGNDVLTLSGDYTAAAGDQVTVGVRPTGTIETQYVNADGIDPFRMKSLNLRYHLDGNGDGAPAWVKAEVLDEKGNVENFTSDSDGALEFCPLGMSTALVDPVRQIKIPRGSSNAREQSVRLTLKGLARVRLIDMMLEVEDE